jgi:hypothetical protein
MSFEEVNSHEATQIKIPVAYLFQLPSTVEFDEGGG